MNILKSIRLIPVFLSMLAIIALFPSQTVLAAGSNVSVSPSTQSLQPGQTFTVQMRGFVSSDFFGASRIAGALTFPANLLQVTAVNTDSATFNWQKTHSTGAGVVNFDQRSLFPIDNTNVSIATVTFRALANGTANVGYSGGTTFSYNNMTIATARNGGTYSISTPTCPAGQTGTPPNCVTPPPPPTPPTPNPPQPTPPTPTPPTTPTTPTPSPIPDPLTPSTPIPSPDISEEVTGEADSDENGFSVTDVTATRGYDTALLNWKTSETSKATVSYGTSLKELNKTVDATLLPDTTYEAQLTDLTPGKQYYYTINATADSDAAKTDSYSGVFTARGFPIIITVTENKTLATNAKIKIGEQNYSTDKNGRISLELASGSYNVEIKAQNGTKSFTLTVAKKTIPKNGTAPEIQRFAFDVPTATASTAGNDLWLLGGGLAAGFLLIGGLLFWLWRRRQNQDQQSATVISADNDYTWAQPQNQIQEPLPQQSFPSMPTEPTPPTIDTPGLSYPDYTTASPSAIPEPLSTDQIPAIPTQEAPLVDSQTIANDVDQAATMPSTEPNFSNTSDAPALETETEPAPPIESGEPALAQMPPQEPESEIATVDTSMPAAQVIQTSEGSELQINHENEQRHNSVYIDEETPEDMFEAAKNNPPSQPPQ